MTECFWCGHVFDGTYYRWLCPNCGAKDNCCEGAPCPLPGEDYRARAEQPRRVLYDISNVLGRPE